MSLNSSRICIDIDENLNRHIHSRVNYIFEIFCSVYGLKEETKFETIKYGPSEDSHIISNSDLIGRDCFDQPPVIRLIDVTDKEFVEKFGISQIPVFSKHDNTKKIDWIAEAFEWLSLASEYSVKNRDSIGRVHYNDMYFGHYRLDPKVPYASVALYFLYKRIFGTYYTGEGAETKIGLSHDIDFLPTDFRSVFVRNFKYSVIQFLRKEYLLSLITLLSYLLQLIRKKPKIGSLETIVNQEKKIGVKSTFFFIFSKLHRRDANYDINSTFVKDQIFKVSQLGNEIAIHNSYTSFFEEGQVEKEFFSANKFTHNSGSRAHWLRFPSVQKLIDSLELSKASYDSSIGFSAKVGFRSGANFPYPFYNFKKESASSVFVLPLAVMDGALSSDAANKNAEAFKVLNSLGKYDSLVKKSGYSFLWHNTSLEGTEYSKEIKNLYWDFININKSQCCTCIEVVNSFKGKACEL